MNEIIDHVIGNASEPLERVFFQVVVDFNKDFIASRGPLTAQITEDDSSLESAALGTYIQAQGVVEEMLDSICNKFPGSMITELNLNHLDHQLDEYHLCIKDESGEEIAKLGIIAVDYSSVTIH